MGPADCKGGVGIEWEVTQTPLATAPGVVADLA